MKKVLAAVLLGTVVLASCGGHNAAPPVTSPFGQSNGGSAGTDVAAPPRGTDAVAVANPGPYGYGETYTVQLYTAGQTPAGSRFAKMGTHPLVAIATPTPTPTPIATPCPPGMIGAPPVCTPMPCPPGTIGAFPACFPIATPTPSPTPSPTPAPTLPPGPGTIYNNQMAMNCLIAPQAITQQNTSVSSLSPAFSSGSGYGRLVRSNSKATNSMAATSYISNVNILSGLITAASVTSNAGATLQAPSGSATFQTLKINGRSVVPSGQPNQNIAIPGVGYVILNEQQIGGGPAPGGFMGIAQTAGIHLYITDASNPYGLAPGYDILVGLAVAAIQVPFDGAFPTAQAYGFQSGTTTPIANLLENCGMGGDSAWVPSATLGTDGTISDMETSARVFQGSGFGSTTRTVRGKHGASLLSNLSLQTAVPAPWSGRMWGRDVSGILGGGSAGQSESYVDSGSLGSDLTFQSMDVQSAVLYSPGLSASGALSMAQVQVNSLTVGGKTYSGTVPTNTRVNIPGLGYAILAQTINTSTGKGPFVADAIGIHLYVTIRNNAHGLPVGDYAIGRAHADIAVMANLFQI